jgi:hypothetical protein
MSKSLTTAQAKGLLNPRPTFRHRKRMDAREWFRLWLEVQALQLLHRESFQCEQDGLVEVDDPEVLAFRQELRCRCGQISAELTRPPLPTPEELLEVIQEFRRNVSTD